MKNSTIIIIIVVLLLGIGIGYYVTLDRGTPVENTYTPAPTQSSDQTGTSANVTVQTPAPAGSTTAGPGEHCGGNMTTAKQCSAGYHCAPTPGSHLPFGDVGGTCVAN
jgi:hypothetical protein